MRLYENVSTLCVQILLFAIHPPKVKLQSKNMVQSHNYRHKPNFLIEYNFLTELTIV
uniref:Uncharacterized protein n=1 Tax=Meloidogyne enterolobii TaxID=390850 RepID=A0A6V7WA29_MELEN|nr:unnamed protein product [Meloidogyne enterolobii]